MTAPLIRLRNGERAIFGYGSLCLRESMERTLGHRCEGPFVSCSLEGWRRFMHGAGFEELEHYYRPPGQPRERQPWLASVWRRAAAP